MATTYMCIHALIHTHGFIQTIILGREQKVFVRHLQYITCGVLTQVCRGWTYFMVFVEKCCQMTLLF